MRSANSGSMEEVGRLIKGVREVAAEWGTFFINGDHAWKRSEGIGWDSVTRDGWPVECVCI